MRCLQGFKCDRNKQPGPSTRLAASGWIQAAQDVVGVRWGLDGELDATGLEEPAPYRRGPQLDFGPTDADALFASRKLARRSRTAFAHLLNARFASARLVTPLLMPP